MKQIGGDLYCFGQNPLPIVFLRKKSRTDRLICTGLETQRYTKPYTALG